jgi:hypothetical protein
MRDALAALSAWLIALIVRSSTVNYPQAIDLLILPPPTSIRKLQDLAGLLFVFLQFRFAIPFIALP